MKAMLFATVLLTLVSTAQAVGVTEVEDFGDTYEAATRVPLGSFITGAITPDDSDYLLFDMPGKAKAGDSFHVDFELFRAASPDRTRVIVYQGRGNIVGYEDFYAAGSQTFDGRFYAVDPKTMIVGIGKLFAIGTDATYSLRLSTSIIPEPTTRILSLLAFGAVLGLGRRPA